MTQTTEQERRRGPALARQGSGIRALGTAVWRDRLLYLLLVLPVAFFVVFHYVPMYGLSLASGNGCREAPCSAPAGAVCTTSSPS